MGDLKRDPNLENYPDDSLWTERGVDNPPSAKGQEPGQLERSREGGSEGGEELVDFPLGFRV